MPTDHPLKKQPFVSLEDFGRHKLLSHTEAGKNRFYQVVLKPEGIKPPRLMTVGSHHAIVAMVAAGFGLSVFPAWAVRSALEANGICARPITGGGLPLTWRVVHLAHSRIPAHQKAFVDTLVQLRVDDIGALPDCPVAVQ
jgi:DNA-binding transcriptional LysR family regulator